MRRVLTGLLILVAGVAGSVVAASAADARAAGSIDIAAVNPQINAGSAPSFRYTTHSLGGGTTLTLQRHTSTGWKDLPQHPPLGTNLVVKAPATGSTPAKYAYRLLASTGVASAARYIYAYASVSMQTVCPNTATDQQFPRVCGKKTTPVGGSSLTTSMSIGAVKYPNFFAGANLPNPSCRSADLKFTVNGNSTYKGYLKISQGNGVPVVRGQATAAVAHIGTLHVTFTSGKIYFNGATENPGGGSLFIAGTFSCYTASGLAP